MTHTVLKPDAFALDHGPDPRRLNPLVTACKTGPSHDNPGRRAAALDGAILHP